ncbi:hypothetical protein CCHL11_02016 [Colletotrichum chlorophyti]|uniref:Restriction of telomere capping protein 4 n=1 Tax=Colletotrichum chlorophyti TaxID=708187 RepID=A0A1Q8RVJ3_9PEZI|nr:hypothetical protein CCHL11_02016 [Colletotrichum chlorophyti]
MPSGSGTRLSRRAGLSRKDPTPGLLRQVNNQVRVEKNIQSVDDDKPVDRPPDDSDDELTDPGSLKNSSKPGEANPDEHPNDQGGGPLNDFQSKSDTSSDDEKARQSRANMARPYFGTSKSGQQQAKAFSLSRESSSGQKRPVSSQGSTAATQGSKRASTNVISPYPVSKRSKSSGSGGETKIKKAVDRRLGRTYSSRANEKAKRAPVSSKTSADEGKTGKREKEACPPSPKKALPAFKSYGDDPFEKFGDNTPAKGLVMSMSNLPSSPLGTPPKASLRHSSLSPDLSSRRTAKIELKHPSGSFPGPLPRSDKASAQPCVSSSKPVFKGGEMKKYSFSDLSDFSDIESDDYDGTQAAEAHCPMCNQAVDKALLESFSNGARLNIRRQIQFCRLHKKKSAEDAWNARGYPNIDWEGLSDRLPAHFDLIEKIINGSPSHYGSLLIDKVKDGKSRTLLKAEDSLTPGYYGPRGLRALSENIIRRFSSVLRERAVADRLISSRGYSSYVEAVLVPELAVQLICEDMEVRSDQARHILEDSKWIGDLLHEDVGDTVDHVSDDERTGC